EGPLHEAELVFPPHPKHNHAPGIVECPNGDLLVSWYRGSGERSADDVAVFGARKKARSDRWSDAFLLADTPGFPDCNTALFIDSKSRLWLFWPVILANSWESCLTCYRVSSDYQGDGAPRWEWQGIIALKPKDFEEVMVRPFAGFGSIQPAVVERKDGSLVAYMRENGPLRKVRVSESKDQGVTWGRVGVIDLPNPGSGLDALRLHSGNWLLVYNDTRRGRNSLAVSLSADEGATWKWTRHLEKQELGSYHYPAVIQAKDGGIHAVYSYFVKGGKSMKHARFNEAWVKQGDSVIRNLRRSPRPSPLTANPVLAAW